MFGSSQLYVRQVGLLAAMTVAYEQPLPLVTNIAADTHLPIPFMLPLW
jgi:hypothetical protein